MKITWRRALIGLSIMAVFGMVVLVSGVFPIKASSGHWAVTRWLLDFASDRSVAFHAQGIEVPELDAPTMVTLGAATYASNCQFCHGRPGETQPPVAQAMTPTPPNLTVSAQDMQPNELFYVVKHGIKFTGMPAWATSKREDEIWPVVAFLKHFPELSDHEYRRLVEMSPPADTPQVVQQCAACHGVDGNARAGERVPLLAGQNQTYLRNSLLAYRSGRRHSGVMMPVAHLLSDQDITELSTHFASQTPVTNENQAPTDAAAFARGQTLALEGEPREKIPSCVDCHGPGEDLHSEDYPLLVGQPRWYLVRQLELFAERNRGGSADASLMHPIADKLTAEQRRDLATFYSAADYETP